jgi:hypothetical protein
VLGGAYSFGSAMSVLLKKLVVPFQRHLVVVPTMAGYLVLALGIPCPAGVRSDCCQADAVGRQSCCSSGSRCCCTQPSQPSKTESCCSKERPHQGDLSRPGKPTGAQTDHAPSNGRAWQLRHCGGPANLWATDVTVSMPSAYVAWSFEWAPDGWLAIFSLEAVHSFDPPSDPPPRSFP